MGVPQADICKVILGPKGKPLAINSLVKHFREELDTGTVRANAKVAGALFRTATDPAMGAKAIAAQIFWLKTRAGWKETAGADNGVLHLNITGGMQEQD
jgi:hypothetical protein